MYIQSEYMKEILAYWKTKYSWRKQEKILNSFDHFRTNIEGIDIHYLHAKPKSKTGKAGTIKYPYSHTEFYAIHKQAFIERLIVIHAVLFLHLFFHQYQSTIPGTCTLYYSSLLLFCYPCLWT